MSLSSSFPLACEKRMIQWVWRSSRGFTSRCHTMTLPLLLLLFYIVDQCRWRHSTWISCLILLNKVRAWISSCRHTPVVPKVRESIILPIQEIPLLITANTTAGEATDANRNYRERETSVNFPCTEPACDWFSTQISKRVLLSYL